MFKILIIDDDCQRRGTLEELFKHEFFDLEYIFEKNEIFQKSRYLYKYDCIFCDISLDLWLLDGDIDNMFDTVVSIIGDEIPIVIYSSDFKQVSHWTNILLKREYRLIYTISLKHELDDIAGEIKLEPYNETRQIICNNIYLRLVAEKKFSVYNTLNGEELSILHISDLQFGDKDQHHELEKAFASTLNREILKKKIAPIDFIIITGDVTYDGSPLQYQDAYLWLKNLCECLLGENYKDRILLVPGNHDINLSMCSLNIYKYNYPKDDEEAGTISLEKREFFTEEYSKYALDPFREFAYKITSDKKWIENESLSFINEKFSYLGVRFIHLNTLDPGMQIGKIKPEFILDKKLIELIQRKGLRTVDGDCSTIVIAHPSPKYLGYDPDEEGGGKWATILNFFKDMNVGLYLFGHRHKNLKDLDIPIDKNNKMKISGSATLLCKPDLGDTRGFKIVKVRKRGRKVTQYIIEKYNYKNDGEIVLEK